MNVGRACRDYMASTDTPIRNAAWRCDAISGSCRGPMDADAYPFESIALTAAAMLPLPASRRPCRGEGIDKAKADAFDVRMFVTAPGPEGLCLLRAPLRPRSSGAASQAESQRHEAVGDVRKSPSDENTVSYSFRPRRQISPPVGAISTPAASAATSVAEDAGHEMRFGCGVDCDGGGIGVALSKDDKSAIIRLERVRIWQNNKPDEEAGDSLVAGADHRDLPAGSARHA